MLYAQEEYLNSPAGETFLVEVFSESNTISIIISQDIRIDLEIDSAIDLADMILMSAAENKENRL